MTFRAASLNVDSRQINRVYRQILKKSSYTSIAEIKQQLEKEKAAGEPRDPKIAKRGKWLLRRFKDHHAQVSFSPLVYGDELSSNFVFTTSSAVSNPSYVLSMVYPSLPLHH